MVKMGKLELVFIVAAVLHAAQASDCRNTLDGSFFNRCFHQDPNFWTVLASTVKQFVNPRAQAIFVVGLLLLLPNLVSRRGENKNSFARTYMTVLNYLHRITFTLILDVGLYCVFRQRRPCACASAGGAAYAQIGSKYGMPSGDAMGGAVLGAFLIDQKTSPVASKSFSRALGIFIVLAVCAERTTLGFHSVGQVMTGSTIGAIVHIYNTRFAKQYCVFIDAAVQIILTLVSVNIDPNPENGPDGMNNLLGWAFWGIGFEIVVLILMRAALAGLRQQFGLDNAPQLALPEVHARLADDDSAGTSMALLEEERGRQVEKREDSTGDRPILWTRQDFFVSGIVLVLFSMLSFATGTFNWFSHS